MAIIGIQTDRTNPTFTKADFVFWMPNFYNFFYQTVEGQTVETAQGTTYWNKLYPQANNRVFKSIFGTDFEIAISLVIAHYLTLVAFNAQAQGGSQLAEIANGGMNAGVMSSGSVGGFSVSYDIDKTISSDDESKWWNLTKWGSQFYALMKTKSVSSIFVVTNNPVPEVVAQSSSGTWTCPECGCTGIRTNVCPICGTERN